MKRNILNSLSLLLVTLISFASCDKKIDTFDDDNLDLAPHQSAIRITPTILSYEDVNKKATIDESRLTSKNYTSTKNFDIITEITEEKTIESTALSSKGVVRNKIKKIASSTPGLTHLKDSIKYRIFLYEKTANDEFTFVNTKVFTSGSSNDTLVVEKDKTYKYFCYSLSHVNTESVPDITSSRISIDSIILRPNDLHRKFRNTDLIHAMGEISTIASKKTYNLNIRFEHNLAKIRFWLDMRGLGIPNKYTHINSFFSQIDLNTGEYNQSLDTFLSRASLNISTGQIFNTTPTPLNYLAYAAINKHTADFIDLVYDLKYYPTGTILNLIGDKSMKVWNTHEKWSYMHNGIKQEYYPVQYFDLYTASPGTIEDLKFLFAYFNSPAFNPDGTFNNDAPLDNNNNIQFSGQAILNIPSFKVSLGMQCDITINLIDQGKQATNSFNYYNRDDFNKVI